MSLRDQAFTLLLFLAAVHLMGSIVIELVNRSRKYNYLGSERRKTRKIAELDPLGEDILREVDEMLDQDKISMEDGLKFIIRMMQRLYVADTHRTLKVNELVEQFNLIQNKNVMSWIEERPKLALFVSLVMMALVVDEIRGPIMKFALSQIGIDVP
jgi:hypothetical protein